jgi:hypothetical protein
MRHATKGHPLVIEDAGVLLLRQHGAHICLFGDALPLHGGVLLLLGKLLCVHDLQIAVNLCVDEVASARDRQSALCSVVCYLDLFFQVLDVGGELVAYVDEPNLLTFERLSQLNNLRLHLFAECSMTKLNTQVLDGANMLVARLSAVNKLRIRLFAETHLPELGSWKRRFSCSSAASVPDVGTISQVIKLLDNHRLRSSIKNNLRDP